jgi:hypothetical protein
MATQRAAMMCLAALQTFVVVDDDARTVDANTVDGDARVKLKNFKYTPLTHIHSATYSYHDGGGARPAGAACVARQRRIIRR